MRIWVPSMHPNTLGNPFLLKNVVMDFSASSCEGILTQLGSWRTKASVTLGTFLLTVDWPMPISSPLFSQSWTGTVPQGGSYMD